MKFKSAYFGENWDYVLIKNLLLAQSQQIITIVFSFYQYLLKHIHHIISKCIILFIKSNKVSQTDKILILNQGIRQENFLP